MDTPAEPQHVSRTRYAIFAGVIVASLGVVAAVAQLTGQRIEANQRAWFVQRLESIVPSELRDNDLYADRTLVRAPEMLGTDQPVTIYRARRAGEPTAAIFAILAPEGYGGNIELLIGVDFKGAVLGVDVLSHNETQGIGDGFAPHRSTWLKSLQNRSLGDPAAVRWTIRQDEGAFDQFTGASITPRAILKSVRNTLEYYISHRDRIFDAPAAE